MTMNTDVDGYTKTLNHWKILRKSQNISQVGARFLRLAFLGGRFAPLLSDSYATARLSKRCLRLTLGIFSEFAIG